MNETQGSQPLDPEEAHMLQTGGRPMKIVEWYGNESREVFPEVMAMDIQKQAEQYRSKAFRRFWNTLKYEVRYECLGWAVSLGMIGSMVGLYLVACWLINRGVCR